MRSTPVSNSFLFVPLLLGGSLLLGSALVGCGATAEEPVSDGDPLTGVGGTVSPGGTGTAPDTTTPPTGTGGSTTTPPGSTAPVGTNPVPMPTGSTPDPDSSGTPDPTPTGTTPDPVPTGTTPDPMPTGTTPDPMPTGTDMPNPPPMGNGSCSFTVNHELSSAIGTVGIVTWSTDMTVESASIEFGLAGAPPTMSAPVDLTAADYRTLLLGMKGDRDYVFHIVAQGGGQTCTSEDFMLTTAPIRNDVSLISRQVQNEASASQGFIVTSAGLGNVGGFGGGGFGGGGGGTPMFIFDTDGDIVWWADAPSNCSRARMDWEGKNMWMTALNYPQSGGEMRRVSMDGLDTESVPALANNHHDFTVVPGGIVTSISYEGGCDAIIERSPDGSTKTIVASTEQLYQPGGGLGGGFECHGNSITYQAEDDTYVLSDRNPSLFVRFSRDGSLIWQFGGSSPKGQHFTGSWNVNHGHHLLPDGNFVFFNNESGNSSPVLEYLLDEQSGMASEVWSYSGSGGSATLGDVQRLPNGNTLITYSNSGTIVEVDANKMPVQTFTTGSLGYVMFRESLYGPPPK